MLMSNKLVISYPHMGSYAHVFHQLLRHLFPEAQILTPPPITNKTLELGAKYSPDFICAPFKYNMGNYIEALEQGANVLFQSGLGCRYGYYGELQEQILRDMGYDFRFICLSRERAKLSNALKILRELGCAISLYRCIEAVLLALGSIRIIDRFEYWMRENIGFEVAEGECELHHKKLLSAIEHADSFSHLRKITYQAKKTIQEIQLRRPEHPLRVGIVGELYTLMEPFSNFEIEKQLAREGIVVSRIMGLRFLLIGKKAKDSLGCCGGYLRNHVGANGTDSVSQSLRYARMGYDGVLHLKSFGCIPELNATPALMSISQEHGIPVLHLSFDSHSSETGVQTRLEAFVDMLRMRKEAAL